MKAIKNLVGIFSCGLVVSAGLIIAECADEMTVLPERWSMRIGEMANLSERPITASYTNQVAKLLPKTVDVRSDDSVEKLRDEMENYVSFVRWGAVLINENMSIDLAGWNFLLTPIVLIRQEIRSHKQWLNEINKMKG